MATIAVRWLKLPCVGYFDDFGIVATDSAAQEALRALTAPNDIPGFELKVTKS